MSDLIRRQAVLDALEESGYCYHFWIDIENIINSLPSAEVVLQTPQTYGKSINPNTEIISDLIRREDAVEAILGEPMNEARYPSWYASKIKTLPSAEAVEVVRCKDCKYTKTDGMEQPAIYCEKWDRWEMPEDFFCAYGYRKGGDDE